MKGRDARRVEALQSLLRKQQADLSEARLAFAHADAERERAASRLRDAASRTEAAEREMRESLVCDGRLALDALERWRAYLAVQRADVGRRRDEHAHADAQCDVLRARVVERARAREASERLRDRAQAKIDTELRRAEYDALDEHWILRRGHA